MENTNIAINLKDVEDTKNCETKAAADNYRKLQDEARTRKELEEQLDEKRKGIPTKFLRTLGVLVIILASVIYMFQGIDGIAPYQRHWIFLGITALFGGLTWFIGGVLKEMKGARTFVSLAVASVPVLFTQLGAMLHWLTVGKHPEMSASLDFSAVNAGLFAGVTAVTLLVTLPLILVGNRIMARNQQKMLSIMLILSNALLLIPVRSLIPVGIIMSISIAAILAYAVKTFQKDATVRNREGSIALFNLFIPIGIIGIRTVSLYGQGPIFTGLLWILGGISAVVLPMNRKNGFATTVQVAGAFAVVTGWILALGGISISMSAVYYYLLAIPAGLIVYALSFTLNKGAAVALRRLSVVVLAGAMVFGQQFYEGALPVLATLVSGVVFIAAAARMKEKTALYLGAVCIGWGVLGMLILIATALSNTTWLVLMFGGILIILGGSLTEVFNKKWKGHAVQFKEELAAWK